MTFNNDYTKCKFPKAAALGRGRNIFPLAMASIVFKELFGTWSCLSVSWTECSG